MGYWSNKQIEEWDRGFEDSDKSACERHFTEPILIAAHASGAEYGWCDFCERDRKSVSNLTQVLEVVAETFFVYWNSADNEGVMWDGREGGYQAAGADMDVDDAFYTTFEDEFSDEQQVWEAMQSCFLPATVVPCNFMEFTTSEALTFDWETFTDEIKHRTRYVFLTAPAIRPAEEDRPEPATHMLAKIAELLQTYGCVETMRAGTRWHRGRVHKLGESCSNPDDLATVPDHLAKFPNRMSPSGIPMFYGAADGLTALAEIWTPGTRGCVATTGVFCTIDDMVILNLTKLPPLPSIFDLERREEREELLFLRAFIDEMRKPIEHDGREHTEYVPTQVVTEYYRRVVRGPNGEPFGGLLYRSSRNPTATCCVIFATHEDCLPPEGPFTGLHRQVLKFESGSATLHHRAGRQIADLRRRTRQQRYWPWS